MATPPGFKLQQVSAFVRLRRLAVAGSAFSAFPLRGARGFVWQYGRAMGHSRRRRTVADEDGYERIAKGKREQPAGGARGGDAQAPTASGTEDKGDSKAMRAAMAAAALVAKRKWMDDAYRRGRANPWNGCRDRPDTAPAPEGGKGGKKGKGKGKG